ncbi:hypothetical protein [Enterocloster lavalensis]|nr:hypothetical protein [Enterocloster lavalensis]
MERWVLAVGYDKDKFNEAQRECLKYGVFIHLTSSCPDHEASMMTAKKR